MTPIDLPKPLDDESISGDAPDAPMPEGIYTGIIIEAEETVSKAGNDMIKLTVQLDGNDSYNGKLLWYYLVFGTEYSLEQMKRVALAIGLDIKGMKQVSAEMFIDLPVKFKVKHEEGRGEYAGVKSEKIHFFVKHDAFDHAAKLAGVDKQDDDESIPF